MVYCLLIRWCCYFLFRYFFSNFFVCILLISFMPPHCIKTFSAYIVPWSFIFFSSLLFFGKQKKMELSRYHCLFIELQNKFSSNIRISFTNIMTIQEIHTTKMFFHFDKPHNISKDIGMGFYFASETVVHTKRARMRTAFV